MCGGVCVCVCVGGLCVSRELASMGKQGSECLPARLAGRGTVQSGYFQWGSVDDENLVRIMGAFLCEVGGL